MTLSMFGKLLERTRIGEILCLYRCVVSSLKKNRLARGCLDVSDWRFVVEILQSETCNASG